MSNIRPSNLPIEETDLIGFVHTDRGVAGSAKFNLANVSSALNLDGMATQAPSNVAITGGSITGITDLTVADGGTGASTASDARVNLLPSYSGNGSKVLSLNSGATDVEWTTNLSGDVFGPASSTDNAVVRYDSTTGKLVQNSGVTISDADLLTTTDLTVNDDTVLGSSNSDTVNFNARVASDINPATDNTYDLGVTGHEWRNLNIDGTANIDSLVADTADINGGTIDGTTVGAGTPSTGAFTTLSATGAASITGAVSSANAFVSTGSVTANGADRSTFDFADGANARIIGWGPTTGTAGAVNIVVASSNASILTTVARATSTGLAVTGALSCTGALAIGNTVNTVSPTSPNRTITMVIGGTTYYLHAKTTND